MKKNPNVIVGVVLLLMGMGWSQYGVDGKLTKKPNILFIFSDDHSPRTVGVLGNPVIKTPALDSLGNAGMIFHNMYNQGASGGAVCVSSRLMLNTGRFYNPNNTQENGNTPLWGKAMQDLGYIAYESGKWHNGGEMLGNSFTKHKSTSGCACPTSDQTGNAYYRPYGEGGTAENPKANGNDWDPTNTIDGHYGNNINFGTGKHSSVAIAEQALQFLTDHKNGSDKEKPWFMYMAFNAPHDFRQAPKEYQDMYPYEDIDFTPSYMEEHPPWGSSWGLRDEKLANYPRDSLIYRQQRSEYYAIITHMDDQIRMVLDSLEDLGMLENTYVIYTADHGLGVGEHALLGKQNLYEHSVGVPFFVAGPGIEPGTESQAMGYLQDVYPTTVAMAGGTPSANLNFRDLSENLTGEEEKGLDEVYFRYTSKLRSVRTEHYKVIVYNLGGDSWVQLFRLKSASNPKVATDSMDVYEIRNLADNEEYAEVLSGMLRLLEEQMDEVGGSVDIPSQISGKILPANQSVLTLPKDTEPVIVSDNMDIGSDFDKLVSLKVFDLSGKYLGDLDPSIFATGKINWDGKLGAQKLSSGVYLLEGSV